MGRRKEKEKNYFSFHCLVCKWKESGMKNILLFFFFLFTVIKRKVEWKLMGKICNFIIIVCQTLRLHVSISAQLGWKLKCGPCCIILLLIISPLLWPNDRDLIFPSNFPFFLFLSIFKCSVKSPMHFFALVIWREILPLPLYLLRTKKIYVKVLYNAPFIL